MDKNKTSIFIGFIAVSAVSPKTASLKLIDLKITKRKAPIIAIGQYVSINILLILTCGLNKTASIIVMHVTDPISIAVDTNYLHKKLQL
jgi:hypothetical protein